MGKDIYISVITLISGSLSFLGGLMLILSHSCIKRLHYIRRMLVCLTIANIIQASGNLLGTVNYLTLKPLDVSKPDRFCVFQSFLTTFSSIASFNWSSMIAVHVFFCVVRKVQTIPKYVCFVYHVVGWLIPGKKKTNHFSVYKFFFIISFHAFPLIHVCMAVRN